MHEMWVTSLDQKDPFVEEMATHSSIHVWRISWTEEPGGLQVIASELDVRIHPTDQSHHSWYEWSDVDHWAHMHTLIQ